METKVNARKFNIINKLDSLSRSERSEAVKALPIILGVKPNTFRDILYAKRNSNIKLAVEHALALSQFFDCSVEDLINVDVPEITPDRITSVCNESLADQYGLCS